eukprot:jgi/Psemu1/37041/gm1.37041_g
MPRPSPQDSFNGCVGPTNISKNAILPPPRKTGDMPPTVSEPYLSTFTRPGSDHVGLLTGKTGDIGVYTRWILQSPGGSNSPQQAHEAPGSALKKEQEEVMKELRSLKSRVNKEKRLLVSVLSRTPTKKKLKLTAVSSCTPLRLEPAKPTRIGQSNELFREGVEVRLKKATKSVGMVLETYLTWLWDVGLHANALWVNSQFNLDVPATDLPEVILLQGKWNPILKSMWEWAELHMVIKITGSQGKLSRGKKQKHTPDLHNGSIPLDNKAIDFILPPAIQTTLHQILSSRAHNNNFIAEPKPQQRNSLKGWLKWSRKRTRISRLPLTNLSRNLCGQSELLPSGSKEPIRMDSSSSDLTDCMPQKSPNTQTTFKSQPLQRTLLGISAAKWLRDSVGWVYRMLHANKEVQVRNRGHGQVLRYLPTIVVSARAGYRDLEAKLEKDGIRPLGKIHHKMLESCVGFLVYVAMTYTSMVPYLKELYLTLNYWRPHRDVFTVSQFEADMNALMEVSYTDDSPRIPARACSKEACYVVLGDASGLGSGSSTWKFKERKIHTEFGGLRKEAANLAESLNCKVASGIILRGLEVFMFMDNFVAESTMYKGFFSSKLLHNMILELWKMVTNGGIIIYVVWISGNQMIWQGTDNLFRGDFTSGVMVGEAFLKGQSKWKITSPDNWFYTVFTDLCQGSVGVAMQRFGESNYPRQRMLRLPLLMDPQYGQKRCMNLSHLNCLLILFCLAHQRRDGLHAWLNGHQFPILPPRDLDNCLVDNKKMEDEETQRFKNPHNGGDHLMTPFQCENCWFFNLKGCAQVNCCPTNTILAKCIWCTTLDTFWSQERFMVVKNCRELTYYFDFQVQLGTDLSCLPPRGPFLQEDFWGMKVACNMLLRSLDEGCNAPFVQFETIRRRCSAFTNLAHTCPEGLRAHLTLQGRGSSSVST